MRASRTWVRPLGSTCLPAGILLLAASFFIAPSIWQGQQWADEQAQAYTEAANRFHQQVHQAAEHRNDPAAQQQLEDARTAFQQQQQRLKVVQRSGGRVIWVLRTAGIVLVVLGAGLLRALDGMDGEAVSDRRVARRAR